MVSASNAGTEKGNNMKKGLLLTLGSVVSLVIIFTLMKTKEEPTFSPLKTVVKNTNENQKKKIKRVSIKPLQTKEELKKNYTSLSPRISEVTTDAKEVEYASPAEELYRKNFQEALDKGYGKTPVITEDNTQVQSVVEALNSGKHPERLSPLIRPAAFDQESWQTNKDYKQKYLNTAEFGRVFQSLNPALGTPKTKRVTPYYQQVAQGEKITLAVKTAADMPVTFTSFDLGKFSNGLTTQTVVANNSGYAEVEFHGMSGTIADVNILASSPAASGQVKFLVYTKLNKNGTINEN